MTQNFIIQKGIPIPPRSHPNELTLASVLRKMQPGDCIDLPKASNIYAYGKRYGIKFTTRRLRDAQNIEFTRVWVTALRSNSQ